MRFIDETEILVTAGKGGDGLVSFRSVKNRPKQGIDGGDGGRGGHVYLKAESGLNSLGRIRYKHEYRAENGERGGSNGKTGRAGKDLFLSVPRGTIARDVETGKVVAEVLDAGETDRICSGGVPGKGNAHFLNPRRQMPTWSTKGTEGETLRLQLELKLLADVGFAGLPNAGKSSLLRAISAARPRVANFPFTTLEPQLGVVDLLKDTGAYDQTFVAADIPGLIAGASQGRGLGHKFLRHLERTAATAYVIDPSLWPQEQPIHVYELLRAELETFNPNITERQSIIVLSKADQNRLSIDMEAISAPFRELGIPVVSVSSLTGIGIRELKIKLYELVQTAHAHTSMLSDPLDLPSYDDYELLVEDPIVMK